MSSFFYNIYDENDNKIDCKYKCWHKETNKWSNVYDTENKKISVDNENTDWDGNGVSFANGDIAIIKMWTDGGLYGVFKVDSDGSDTYTGNRQLKSIVAPNCSIGLVAEANVNVEVTAYNNGSDDYQWVYDGVTHYHRDTWYGQNIFAEIGISTVEWKYDNGAYSNNDKHTWVDHGTKTVWCKLTNVNGQVTECSKSVNIKELPPVVELSVNPVHPKIGESTEFIVTNNDPVGVIVGQSMKLDGTNTTDSVFVWNELGTHTYVVTTTWNDGFNNIQFDTSIQVHLDNQAPTCNMEIVKKTNNSYDIIPNASDPEGLMHSVLVRLHIDKKQVLEKDPTNHVFVLIDSKTVTIDPYVTQFNVYKNGTYKIDCVAVDQSMAESIPCSYMIEITDAETDTTSEDGDKKCTVAEIVYVECYGDTDGEIEVTEANGDIDDEEADGDVDDEEADGDTEEKEAES